MFGNIWCTTERVEMKDNWYTLTEAKALPDRYQFKGSFQNFILFSQISFSQGLVDKNVHI